MRIKIVILIMDLTRVSCPRTGWAAQRPTNSATAPAAIRTICSVLEETVVTTIMVRGTVGFTLGHGVAYVRDEDHPKGCPKLKDDAQKGVWPSVISADWSLVRLDGDVSKEIALIRDALKTAKSGLEFRGVLSGRIRRKSDVKIWQASPSGQRFGNGFGPFGGLPAEILIDTVSVIDGVVRIDDQVLREKRSDGTKQ